MEKYIVRSIVTLRCLSYSGSQCTGQLLTASPSEAEGVHLHTRGQLISETLDACALQPGPGGVGSGSALAGRLDDRHPLTGCVRGEGPVMDRMISQTCEAPLRCWSAPCRCRVLQEVADVMPQLPQREAVTLHPALPPRPSRRCGAVVECYPSFSDARAIFHTAADAGSRSSPREKCLTPPQWRPYSALSSTIWHATKGARCARARGICAACSNDCEHDEW
jgi:hypothetical protein